MDPNHIITKTTHKEVYPAISPLRPELSQAGKTVLVTGATGGIGYSIALSFGQAGAAKVLISSRSLARSQEAAKKLTEELASMGGLASTVFEGRECVLADPASVTRLWDELAAEDVYIDVLVLNAAKTDVMGLLGEAGWQSVWSEFEVNVRSTLQLSERFLAQKTAAAPAADSNSNSNNRHKYLVNVSTAAIHEWALTRSYQAYGLTKHSATLALQLLATNVGPADDDDGSKAQIVSFHPGAVLSPAARSVGYDENSFPWDNANLAAGTAVWCATPEAAFLHGRFFWAPWDVEELQQGAICKRLDQDDKYLRLCVGGL